ncbi:E3 ubiquitin-protein ligase RBX1, partial [Fragariocoptes setiger]
MADDSLQEMDVAEEPGPSNRSGESEELCEFLQGNKRFHVKKWNAVAMWTWDIAVDNCAICRNHIMDKCIECQSVMEQSNVDENCSIAWGKCSHVFHLHCISRWLNTRQVCPLDNRHWEFRKYGS